MADDFSDEELGISSAPVSRTGLPSHGPHDYTDEELGIDTGPLRQHTISLTPGGKPIAATSATEDVMHPRARIAPELEGDPTAQNLVAGVVAGGAGRLVAPVLGRVAGPMLARAGQGAVEGSTATAAQGGSPKQVALGAAIGAGLGAVGGAVEGAPARVRERASSVQDIVQGEGEGAKPSKPLRRKLAAKAGDEGEALADELDKDPDLERKLSVTVKRHPKEAAAALNEALDRHDAAIEPEYKAITDSGGVKLTSVVSPMQKLKDSYLAAGSSEEAEAVQREIDSLTKNYGGKEPENAVLTGEQLRGIKKQIGRAAFPDRATPGSVKYPVKRALYGAYRGAIEDAVGTLQGVAPVDLARFRAHNQSMSQLMPMRDVLEDRAASAAAGDKSILGRAAEFVGGEGMKPGALPMLALRKGFTPDALKEALIEYVGSKAVPALGRLAAQGGRHIDAALARSGGVSEGAAAPVVRAATTRRTVKDASPMLRGISILGRPATAQERTAAGLPASLQHAIDTNDPVLGHAALTNEVFGQ